MTYEYSIIKTFLNQFINLNIGIFIYALYRMKDKESLVNKHIIYIFIIQAFIQLISFINPRINEFLNIFRYDGAIIVGQLGYGGIRGLSISGTSFFGLGVGYGLVYIYYFANWEKIFVEYKIFKYVFLLLLIFGGMSAARSSSIGLILGALYFIINKISKKNFKRSFKVKNFIMMFLIIILSTFSINVIKENESLVEKFQRMDRFVFQIIYNKQDTNKFTTSSTNVLFNNMYFGVREKTLLFGDGMYTNEDGSYYMYTDAGYMRNILYFGMIGVVFLFFYQTRFFIWGNKKLFLENIFILVYILIMNIKGDILGFGIMMQDILFLIYLSNLNSSNIKD